MCMYVYIYYVCMCMYVYIYYVYIYVCILYACIYMCVCLCICKHTHICKCVYVPVHVSICKKARECACVPAWSVSPACRRRHMESGHVQRAVGWPILSHDRDRRRRRHVPDRRRRWHIDKPQRRVVVRRQRCEPYSRGNLVVRKGYSRVLKGYYRGTLG